MKITDVTILNGTGADYWNDVKSRPDEPLIAARIEFVLSWREYHELLRSEKDVSKEENEGGCCQ